MCNFIIRPIKCYATVDINTSQVQSGSINEVKAGDALTVKEVTDRSMVVLVRDDDTIVNIPMETFIHVFSDKDPKEEKKDSKKESK